MYFFIKITNNTFIGEYNPLYIDSHKNEDIKSIKLYVTP